MKHSYNLIETKHNVMIHDGDNGNGNNTYIYSDSTLNEAKGRMTDDSIMVRLEHKSKYAKDDIEYINKYFVLKYTVLNRILNIWYANDIAPSMHEVILEDTPCRIYIDIDKPKNIIATSEDVTKVMVSTFWAISKVLTDMNLPYNPYLDCRIYLSNPTKPSYHIIVKKYCCDSTVHVKEFVSKVLDNIVGIDPTYKAFIDMGVYTKNHTLKLLYCKKPDVDIKNIKTLYNPSMTQYPPSMDDKQKEVYEFLDSCVTWVADCDRIPISLEPKIQKSISYTNTIPDPIITNIINIVEKLHPNQLTYRDTINGNINFDNTSKSFQCTVCNDIHHRENAYVFLNTESRIVYLNCRHTSTSEPIARF